MVMVVVVVVVEVVVVVVKIMEEVLTKAMESLLMSTRSWTSLRRKETTDKIKSTNHRRSTRMFVFIVVLKDIGPVSAELPSIWLNSIEHLPAKYHKKNGETKSNKNQLKPIL